MGMNSHGREVAGDRHPIAIGVSPLVDADVDLHGDRDKGMAEAQHIADE
jgi:hypothetical protein